jgi:hypothetical protein
MVIYEKGAEETILSAAHSSCIKGGDLANLGQFDPGVLALLYRANILSCRRYN